MSVKSVGQGFGVVLIGAIFMLSGCESGGGGGSLSDGHDFGPNDPNVLVAFGDSITAGSDLPNPRTEAYPARLAAVLGKTVISKGYPGASSYDAVDMVHSILDNIRPGYLLILFGVNDLIMGYGEEAALNNLRTLVRAAKDNKTIPVIATLTPVAGEHRWWTSGVNRLNGMIRDMASVEGVALVDLADAFGGDENLLYMSVGLHPNIMGHDIMANAFYEAVK